MSGIIKQAKKVLERPVVLEQMWWLKAVAPSDVVCAFIFYPFANVVSHRFIHVTMRENKKQKKDVLVLFPTFAPVYLNNHKGLVPTK